MKPVYRILTVLFISILVFSSIDYPLENRKRSSVYASSEVLKLSEVAINIGSDSDFVDNGWSGSGTELDPFVLQNQVIGTADEYGYFQIHETDFYFEIRNCQFLQMDIVFWDLSNGRVEDCTFINSSIVLDNCLDCFIIDNEFSGSFFMEETLWLLETSGCVVVQNSFSDGFSGVSIQLGNDTTISDNRFTDFIHGAISGDFANTTLSNNILEGTGFRTDFWDSRIPLNPPTIENNTVNGKELGFFFSLEGSQIDADQYGQVILGNSNDTTITGGTFVDCSTGVQIISSNNCTVEGVTVSDCSWNGITVERSSQTRLVDCHINNCSGGVFLSVSPFYSVENCTIEDNLSGIMPHIYSNNGTILNCTIRRNRPPESEYFVFEAGIHLSSNATVMGNTITENNVGIFIYGAHCLVVDNVITHNGYGIYIGEAYTGYGERPAYNRIFNNDIGWNYLKNAHDRTLRNNEWDDGVSVGNRWSDYYGIGYYVIDFEAVDHFPRLLPEDAVPLFFIHVGVGTSSTIVVILILIVLLKRRPKIPK